MQRPRLSDQIAERLESMIQEGRFSPGQRLPGERNLAMELGVSRPSLREAIQKLASRGLLSTRPGGGTYVQQGLDPSLAEPLVAMLSEQPETRFDVLEIRHALEGTAAWYAAIRAEDIEKARIRECFDRMVSSHNERTPLEEARADAEFHLSIVEASHNLVLLQVMRGLFDLLLNSISHNLDKLYNMPMIAEPLHQQHRDLMEAVLDGDPDRARLAAQSHLTFVEESLQKIDLDEARKTRAMRRLSNMSGA